MGERGVALTDAKQPGLSGGRFASPSLWCHLPASEDTFDSCGVANEDDRTARDAGVLRSSSSNRGGEAARERFIARPISPTATASKTLNSWNGHVEWALDVRACSATVVRYRPCQPGPAFCPGRSFGDRTAYNAPHAKRNLRRPGLLVSYGLRRSLSSHTWGRAAHPLGARKFAAQCRLGAHQP